MARKQTTGQPSQKSTKAVPAKPRFAVLGAGNGGLAFAGHLAMRGFEVSLYNRSAERIEPLRQSKSLQLVADRADLPQGRATLARVTSNLGEALENSDVVMVCVAATAHEDLARMCAPYLRDNHYVLLNPGKTGGALAFLNAALHNGCTTHFLVAEAQTLLYACRATNPGQVKITSVKNSVPIAAIPADRTKDLVAVLSEAYPEFIPGENVMKTSLENIGSVFHPSIMVLNAARIETSRGDFEFYIEGVSKTVAGILEKIDRERVDVAAKMGFQCMTAREWLYVAYGAGGRDLFEAMRANDGYYGIKAPSQLSHRYLLEDVPTCLVPIASMGQELGSPCKTLEAIIHLAGLITGCDFWATGRTTEKMGLKGLTIRDLRKTVLEGMPRKAEVGPPKTGGTARASLAQED